MLRQSMNFEVDELLDEVDRWKKKLQHDLHGQSPSQRAAFWKRTMVQGKSLGIKANRDSSPKRLTVRSPRAGGRIAPFN
jgi:hypothetical protein